MIGIDSPRLSFGLLSVLVVLMGCSSEQMGDVSGLVTLGGTPVANGAITFTPVDGSGRTAGCPIKDGKYTAQVPVGKMQVSITVPRVVGKKKLYNTPDSPEGDLYDESAPAKYNSQTELELDVTSGRNAKDWSLNAK